MGSPDTVESRQNVLPKSYSPPSAPSSWEDRELWPTGITVRDVLIGNKRTDYELKSLVSCMANNIKNELVPSHSNNGKHSAWGLFAFNTPMHSYLSKDFTL